MSDVKATTTTSRIPAQNNATMKFERANCEKCAYRVNVQGTQFFACRFNWLTVEINKLPLLHPDAYGTKSGAWPMCYSPQYIANCHFFSHILIPSNVAHIEPHEMAKLIAEKLKRRK